MTESNLQRKIIKDLEKGNHYIIKTMLSNRNGIADIIGCTFGEGKFFAIEVKKIGGRITELQQYNMTKVQETGGLATVVFTWEDYLLIKSLWGL